MKKIIRIVLFILTVFPFIISSANALKMDDLFATVAFLHMEMPDGKIQYGTGFFVGADTSLFLATADHVSKFLTLDSIVTVRTFGDIPQSFKLGKIIKDEAVWKSHKEADIALIELNHDHMTLLALEKRFLIPSHMYLDKKSLPNQTKITIIGFPLALGTQDSFFSPLTRETKIASGFLKIKRGDTKQPATFFILQDPSIGGFSGAPVFENALQQTSKGWNLISAGPRLVGLVHGTLSDDTGGKLGAITPSYQLHELILECK
jgi:hypothetical protein